MAVIAPPIHIRGDTLGCIQYIQDPEKIVHNDQTANVMRYMQSHCVEDVMSVGYNGCSGIREVAVEQFRASESAYKSIHPDKKKQVTRITVEQYLKSNHRKTVPKHIKVDDDGMITVTKTEVTAEHIVVSMHKDDRVTPEVLQSVLNELMEHPYLKGYPALSNLHWNTDEKHGHILISNYKSDGSRKLSLTGTKLRELRRYMDKICYKHGLSIIDTKEARLDPEHAAWIDKVKAEGRITVHEENGAGLTRCSTQNSWKAAKKRSKSKRMNRIDRIESNDIVKDMLRHQIENEIYYGDKTYFPVAKRTHFNEDDAPRNRYYCISLHYYDKERHRYRRRSKIELIYMLAHAALSGESVVIKRYPERLKRFERGFGPIDHEIQSMLDAAASCREFNVRTPDELDQRVKEIGQAIGNVKKAIAYDKKTVSRQPLYNAILTVRDKTSSEQARDEAYAVLSAFGCTGIPQQKNALERLKMAQERLSENEAYLNELNKSYRQAVKARESLLNARYKYDMVNREAVDCIYNHDYTHTHKHKQERER